MEIIYDYIKILRIKGSSLPIFIKILVEYPKVEYFLKNEEKKFDDIKNYLFSAKNDLIKQLNNCYEENINLRFLYGKQFDSIIKHLETSFNIEPFLRYLLNFTDDELNIKEGYKSNPRSTNDYVGEYNLYNKESFRNISKYIDTFFINNNSSLENHYEAIKIKNTILKGIFLYSSSSHSMEEDILYFFLEFVRTLPIAQNILISNKETSLEEMQAFFTRAILCKFNTLFVIEINDSLSDYQQKSMNNFINKYLNVKNKKKNEEIGGNIDKNKTSDYLDSCIIFIYKNGNNALILNEIQKLKPQTLPNFYDYKSRSFQNQGKYVYENTHILSSTVCGLGKSTKIKDEILNKGKTYIYFPLGGNLSKNDIFKKLSKILKDIEIETKNSYKDIAIHLDLFENKESSILNEFLFSFLITKFYSNNEYIKYIPKNIEIFIEIPNCFEDFLSNYDILKSFNIERIDMENKPKFKLSYKRNILTNMLGFSSDEKVYEFIVTNMKIQKFSYHQVDIFMKLFISQYSKSQTKIRFIGSKDKTEEDIQKTTKNCIDKFAEGTKYFTNGEYAKLLLSANEKEENYVSLLSNVYENDLKKDYKKNLIFIMEKIHKYVDLNISNDYLQKKYKNPVDYLKTLKKILLLKNPVDPKEANHEGKISLLEIINKDEYVITNDNFKKMILILYRITAKFLLF